MIGTFFRCGIGLHFAVIYGKINPREVNPMPHIVKWLLDPSDPCIRYRTMTELLDVPVDSMEAFLARREVLSSKAVTRLFDRLDHRGVFPHVPKYYGNYTTFRYLYALTDLGLRKDDPHINKLVDWILYPSAEKREFFVQESLRDEHAYLMDESNLGSCHQIDFLGTLLKLGYYDDPRIQRFLKVFLQKSRFDGGYLCKWQKGNHLGQTPKSCYTAAVNALRVFSHLPTEYRETETFHRLLAYFTSRKMLYSKTDPQKMIASTISMYNGCGYSHLFVIADAMSRMGLGSIPEMEEVWSTLRAKQNANCRIPLEATDGKETIPMLRVGISNKHLTLKYQICLKQLKRTTGGA
jgi:hypothetical protein